MAPRWAVVALLLLTCLCVVQQTAADLGVVWRTFALTWDSAATLVEDEIAAGHLLTPPPAGPGAAAPLGAARRLAVVDAPERESAVPEHGLHSRAPPRAAT
jgi:hypothetical protein